MTRNTMEKTDPSPTAKAAKAKMRSEIRKKRLAIAGRQKLAMEKSVRSMFGRRIPLKSSMAFYRAAGSELSMEKLLEELSRSRRGTKAYEPLVVPGTRRMLFMGVTESPIPMVGVRRTRNSTPLPTRREIKRHFQGKAYSRNSHSFFARVFWPTPPCRSRGKARLKGGRGGQRIIRLKMARIATTRQITMVRRILPSLKLATTLKRQEKLKSVVVPIIGIDPKTGARLGQGGGYYDVSLGGGFPGTPANPFLLGAGFSLQLVDGLPSESHDARIDAFVSEDGVIHFTRRGAMAVKK